MIHLKGSYVVVVFPFLSWNARGYGHVFFGSLGEFKERKCPLDIRCGEATVHFGCAIFVLEDNAFIPMVLNMVKTLLNTNSLYHRILHFLVDPSPDGLSKEAL